MWPKPIYPPRYEAIVPTTWEYMAMTDGYFADESAERGNDSSDGVDDVSEVFEEKQHESSDSITRVAEVVGEKGM